eukprot:jgi/Mesvir1/27264/Mv07101-RA.1
MTARLASGVTAGPLGVWTTSSSDCCDDGVDECCIGFCCPCILFGKNAEKLSYANCCCSCFLFWFLSFGQPSIPCVGNYLAAIYAANYRGNLRGDLNIPGTFCDDCIMHACCPWCAILQERRELKVRGYVGSCTRTRPPIHQRMD